MKENKEYKETAQEKKKKTNKLSGEEKEEE